MSKLKKINEVIKREMTALEFIQLMESSLIISCQNLTPSRFLIKMPKFLSIEKLIIDISGATNFYKKVYLPLASECSLGDIIDIHFIKNVDL